ncbi:phospho-N-acetylmuramoyl-pentapeptide-transferase [Lyticum sinuosum]|uniref:Phospho-N-acetylmuramoyl-pentapeptide-transferase n=1 Tax=Lyticum sinuosum TaxID=1332059 RepID=A0AAE4VKJ2_9RICK|nr:phospho-N-acetylmuramoyl-pentapeptide-transferase [Lyticum sinuosum]MDZ5761517.1 Phospho-N-acetylmuramoyl-pentapeptide-transferase [Lyticum sinuosum]
MLLEQHECIILIIFSFFIQIFLYPSLIKLFLLWQNGGQPIRDDGPKSHIIKAGTPTMGGIGIIFTVIITTIIYMLFYNKSVNNSLIWACIFILSSYGLIGFIDDYIKIKYRNSYGISGKSRLITQFILALISILFMKISILDISDSFLNKIIYYIINIYKHHNYVNFPFNIKINLGIFYYFFAAIVIVGAANATNLTDGLDGLVSVPLIINFAYFSLISCGIIKYSNINHDLLNISSISYLSCICIGSCLGFLWYNAHPAKIFMGDVGSLSLGGISGMIAVSLNIEILFFFASGLFVIEALSVIIQVVYYRIYKKRIFLMAPIHHHYEKSGLTESQIVIRFWILSLIFPLFSFILFNYK